jgi:uncharacterized repeat protein (TIGR03803 family)
MQRNWILISLTVCLTTSLSLNAWAAAREKVLYQFTAGSDGGSPSSSLLMDASGNLYGTTYYGGSNSGSCGSTGCGVVFELTPVRGGGWRESVLYAFQGALDGAYPSGNLVFDASGNLYGTTSGGGLVTTNCSRQGCGTVFELSPAKGGTWTETAIYYFHGQPDGAGPVGLIFGDAGSLFGITSLGGNSNYGIVYELSPTGQKNSAWSEQILSEFSEGTLNPGLVFDDQGNLFGTYYNINVQFCGFNCGAVFELRHANGQWTETDLFDFLGGGNGGQPAAGVIRDSKGNLYGTAALGGNNFGIVFELSHSNGQWKERMLYNFCSLNKCADGAIPLAGLVMDANGVLYGTTEQGGTGCRRCGVVFKLERTDDTWKETVLYDFQGGDGAQPAWSLILDGRGNLYGTANGGGGGVVFEVMQ